MKPTPISNLTFAWQFLKTEKKAFVLAVVFVILNAGIQTLTPISIEFLINNAIKVTNYDLLFKVIIGMCALFLLEAGIFRTQVKTVGYAAQRIMLKIRTELFGHIQKLPTSYFGQNQSGDLISRINSDTTLLDNFLGQYIFQFTSSFFVFIAFGIYLFILNPILALVAYIGVIITILISYFTRSIGRILSKKSLTNNGILKSYLSNNLNNYQVIEAYNIHSKLVQEFQNINTSNQKTNFASRIFTNVFNPLYNFTGYTSLLLILIAIFYLKLGDNPLYIGTLVAFLFATVRFFEPMRELGSVFGSLAEVQAALGRIREILNVPIDKIFNSNKVASNPSLEMSSFANAVDFCDIDFTYLSTSKKVLNNITFSVPTNSKFAIIGPTGEGKSTIAKLMSGLLSPDCGSIKIFGRELKDWSKSEFYETVGFILQDPFLFTGTVANNIVYGNPKYENFNSVNFTDKEQSNESQKDLIQKLILDINEHNLQSIIPNLEEFLLTKVNNNSQNISQGQKQIVNFIRVLLREPKILILDEATANLDTITETYLQQALDKLSSKVTQIIIAHRQNTIKDADNIMLVGGGGVQISAN